MASQLSDIAELKSLVVDAQRRHPSMSEHGSLRKWLQRFSSRITHYGYILDVLVSHHPEYVALAWGAMKFLFIVSRPAWVRTVHS